MANIVKKPKPGAIMKWDEELAKEAADIAATEKTPTGNFVSLAAGVLSVAGQPMKDNKMEVVIIDHIFENVFYGGEYDKDDPQPPSCYAFGRDEEELKPEEQVKEPEHDQCEGCEKNEWGSAERGKGKACKNTRRLALISAVNLTPDAVEETEVVYMRLPVMSVKGWAHYVKGLAATLKRPPYGVITEVSVRPDPKAQFKAVFEVVEPLPDELVAAVVARRKTVKEQISFPYAEAKAVELKGKQAKRKF